MHISKKEMDLINPNSIRVQLAFGDCAIEIGFSPGASFVSSLALYFFLLMQLLVIGKLFTNQNSFALG